jgi:hypothetical protein
MWPAFSNFHVNSVRSNHRYLFSVVKTLASRYSVTFCECSRTILGAGQVPFRPTWSAGETWDICRTL